jgi:RNA polymerase sigma factor (sigma-70 family)
MTRIILADDHALVREGIRALLDRSPDVEVLGEASDGLEALALVESLKPDILLVDLSMPRLNGIETLKRLTAANSKTRIIVVSIHAEETIVKRALRAGAKGYLLKSAFKEELFLAIRAVARGEIYLCASVATLVLSDIINGTDQPHIQDPLERLSTREREIFQLILEGKSNRQMAENLQISIKTVDKHRTNLMKKLQVHDVTGLMHVALQNHMLYAR